MYFVDEEAHKGLANSILLVKAGIMKEDGTPVKKDVRESVIQIGSDGTPTGYLVRDYISGRRQVSFPPVK